MEIIAVKVPSFIENRQIERLFESVPEKKRERILRFVKTDDRYRSLIGEILTRLCIGRKLRLHPANVRIMSNPFGKPILPGECSLHFNISHSGKWVVGAFGDHPVGIDIEKISPIDLSIVEHFFSKAEVEDLFSKPGHERLSYFYDLWTLKESYIKYCGTGLSLPLDSFSIRKSQDTISITGNRLTCFFKQYTVDKAYKLSVCSSSLPFPEKATVWTFQTLYEQFTDFLNWKG